MINMSKSPGSEAQKSDPRQGKPGGPTHSQHRIGGFSLVDCLDQTLAACNVTLSPVEKETKSNLFKVFDWIENYCNKMILDNVDLAACDEMMTCDLHIEQMSSDNTTTWCSFIGSLVECTNGAINKCSLNELKNGLQKMYEETLNIFCSADETVDEHQDHLIENTPERERSADQRAQQETLEDRITINSDNIKNYETNDDDDDDDYEKDVKGARGKKETWIDGGAAASKDSSDNGSSTLCTSGLLVATLQLLIFTFYRR